MRRLTPLSVLGPLAYAGPLHMTVVPHQPDDSQEPDIDAVPLTRMLRRVAAGEANAADDLLPMVYAQLKRFARGRLAHEQAGHTLQATALVHEAWIKLGGRDLPYFEDRAQFFAAAARAMRNILVDQARRRGAEKRGGGVERQPLTGSIVIAEAPGVLEILALDEALQRLEREHERAAQVVELRYFAGLGAEEVAESLGVSLSTVEREWRFARSWLRRALSEVDGASGPADPDQG
jgi:RNA polymerase sigma factor (TIGR02999 family)